MTLNEIGHTTRSNADMFFSSSMGVLNFDSVSQNNRGVQNSEDNSVDTSSLLTLADMVIALDQQNENSTDGSLTTKDDHNYASSICLDRISTSTDDSNRLEIDFSDEDDEESSALLAELDFITSDKKTMNQNCSSHDRSNVYDEHLTNCKSSKKKNTENPHFTRSSSCNDNNRPTQHNHNSQYFKIVENYPKQQEIINDYSNCPKVKRSSSVENIQFHCNPAEKFISSSLSHPSEMLKVNSPISSPRKSCSFEEINIDHQPLVKSSKSTENILKRQAVSHQLHRVINDNVEFPSWPRKADHTYATATWDGTAASHNLIEKESKVNEFSSEDIQGCQEMDISENGSAEFNFSSTDHQVSLSKNVENVKPQPLSLQRDDHTYTVKSKALQASQSLKQSFVQYCKDWIQKNSNALNPASVKSIPSTGKSDFSSATFPRLKTRDDHTYFQSGPNKKDAHSTGPKEWVSEQTVMVMECTENEESESVVHQVHAQVVQKPNSRMLSKNKSGKREDHSYSSST